MSEGKEDLTPLVSVCVQNSGNPWAMRVQEGSTLQDPKRQTGACPRGV